LGLDGKKQERSNNNEKEDNHVLPKLRGRILWRSKVLPILRVRFADNLSIARPGIRAE
jgi:hypothetical protein